MSAGSLNPKKFQSMIELARPAGHIESPERKWNSSTCVIDDDAPYVPSPSPGKKFQLRRGPPPPRPVYLNKFNPALRVPKQTDPARLEELLKTLMTDPKPEAKVHAAGLIRAMSDVTSHRKTMILAPDLIENMTYILRYGSACESSRRCQVHALAVICNLFLTDPAFDRQLAADDNLIPALHALMQLSDHEDIQTLAAQCLDFIAVSRDNQTLLCSYPELLGVMLRILHSTPLPAVRGHILQALLYFSSHPKNWFLLVRQRDFIGVVSESLLPFHDDEHRVYLSLSIFLNVSALRENIPHLAASSILRQRLRESMQSSNPDCANTANYILHVISEADLSGFDAQVIAAVEPAADPPRPRSQRDQFDKVLVPAPTPVPTREQPHTTSSTERSPRELREQRPLVLGLGAAEQLLHDPAALERLAYPTPPASATRQVVGSSAVPVVYGVSPSNSPAASARVSSYASPPGSARYVADYPKVDLRGIDGRYVSQGPSSAMSSARRSVAGMQAPASEDAGAAAWEAVVRESLSAIAQAEKTA